MSCAWIAWMRLVPAVWWKTILLSFLYSIGSFLYQRAKPPQGPALCINLLGTGLSRRACMGDGGSIWLAPGHCGDTKDERAITVCQSCRPDESVHKCKAVLPNWEPFYYLGCVLRKGPGRHDTWFRVISIWNHLLKMAGVIGFSFKERFLRFQLLFPAFHRFHHIIWRVKWAKKP